MNIHTPTDSLLPHVCSTCGTRDSDPTWHRQAVATVSPRRVEHGDGDYTIVLSSIVPGRLDDEPKAVARRTDPGTSWEAARSVRGIRESQAEVLAMFRNDGPMTDEELVRNYGSWKHLPSQSPSGLRTRRSELVAKGLLRDTGERRRGSTGRRMIVWEAA